MDHVRKKKPRARNADPGAAPTRASLHEAALSYLARGAASADSVVKTLQRRIGNWARRATRAGRDAETVAHDVAAARELIAAIVGRLGEVGLVNDTAFAETRAKRMSSAGRSRRAISAHLKQKGVDAATVREAVSSDASTELAAAIAFARKRRLGPFARAGEEVASRDEKRAAERKALGTMARAGFDFGVCERVLGWTETMLTSGSATAASSEPAGYGSTWTRYSAQPTPPRSSRSPSDLQNASLV